MSAKKYVQIQQQIAKLEREAEKYRKAAIQGVIQKIKDLMEEHGLSMEDIAAAAPGRKRGRPAKSAKSQNGEKTGAKVPPKYRSPSDPSLIWTGRGRSPAWVKAWVDSGKSMDELLIK